MNEGIDGKPNLSGWLMLLLFVGIILTAVVPLSLMSLDFFSELKDMLLTFTLIATPLVSFLGFIWLGEAFLYLEPSLGVFRTAITAAVITEYFVLLALSIFLADQTTTNILQEKLVDNFTTIVGVVIAFYFGSSAYAYKVERTTKK